MSLYLYLGIGQIVTPTNHAPIGNVDVANTTTISGWAADQDNYPVTVKIYIDSILVDTIVTSESRPDVHAVYPQLSSNAGWSSTKTSLYNDGVQHTIQVYAVDIGNSNALVELSSSPKFFTAPNSNPTPTAGLLQMWDGLTGVGKWWWNAGANVPWRNRSYPYGDWYDSVGSTNGNSPYMSLNVGAASVDATLLVSHWLLYGNTGAYVRPNNGGYYGGRFNANQPRLVVQTSAGIFNCACTCSNTLNTGSDNPGAQNQDGAIGGGDSMCIQFDMSAVHGNLISATLYMTSYNNNTNLDWYRIKAPTVRTDFTTQTGGWVVGHNTMASIQADAHCIFAKEWFDPANAGFDPSGYSLGGFLGYFDDPVAGKYVSLRSGPGLYEPASAWRHRSTLLQAPLNEAYLGYWFRFDSHGTTLQGTKMGMSLSGRGGAPTGSNNQLTPICGNGGTPTRGYIYCPGDVINGVSYADAAGSDHYPGQTANQCFSCGWSTRPWEAPSIWESGNPLYPYHSMQSYVYWAGMPIDQSPYAQNFIWEGVQFKNNTWYWIEQHVKMNTVTGADSKGNGIGAADGLLEVWINGNKVNVLDYATQQPITGLKFTNNAQIGIDEIPWVDLYEGGTTDPIDNRQFSLGALVVSDSYIGVPSFQVLPSWQATQQVNEWRQIPNTAVAFNTPLTALVSEGILASGGGDVGYGTLNTLFSYSGGCFDWTTGDFWYWGAGGAGAFGGNCWFKAHIVADSPSITKMGTTSGSAHTRARNSGGPYETNTDGKPTTKHTYWGPHFIPQTGKAYQVLARNDFTVDSGAWNDVWGFDPSNDTWTQYADIPSPNSTAGGRWDGPWQVVDRRNGTIYTGFPFSIGRWFPTTGTGENFIYEPNHVNLDRGAAAMDDNGHILRLGLLDSNASTATMYINVDTGTITYGTLSGLNHLGNPADWFYPRCGGLWWDAGLGKFCAWIDNTILYVLTYVSDSNWSVGTITTTGTPPPNDAGSGQGGTFGRMGYVPQLKGPVLFQNTTNNAYLLKTV